MQEYDHKLKLFACNGSRAFAEQIAQKLNTKLGDSELTVFSDGSAMTFTVKVLLFFALPHFAVATSSTSSSSFERRTTSLPFFSR